MIDEKITYEQAKDELEETVNKLERGNLPLDDAEKLFMRGIELSKYCINKLENMEQRITEVFKDSEGKLSEREYKINE